MKFFISSTFVDLQDYRRVAIDVVNRQQCQPLAMEFFGAQPQEPAAVCEEEVRACDALVGIYAHRYGFIPAGQQHSITQREYELARELGRPCLCFIVQKGFHWNPDFIEFAQKTLLENFLGRIQKENQVAFFTTPEDFGNKLTIALSRQLQKGAATVKPAPHVAPNPEPYFTGREQDLQKLRGLLAKERAFVCIENAPGIGKTQMSLKAAAELRDLFPEVYFLDLGRRNAISPEAITDTLREVLGIAEPLPFEKLLQRVAGQRCLFILDNLETALWSPADENATREMLREWVRLLTPGQGLLATSRALPKAGETTLNLLPLRLDESLLLWQKLRPETPPDEEHLAELLQLADGYPLVIYLLSQRALDLPLPHLLQDFQRRKIDALHIGKGREASMKASIELSYENLARAQNASRRLFHLLGFLPAGATAETLAALCGEGWIDACKDVRHTGLGLWNGERFFALPPLRDFAGQRAAEEELSPLFEFYLKAAKEQDQHFQRDELGETARQWLQTELPNLHHLWDVQLAKQEKKWVLSLAETLARVYQDGVRTGTIRLQTAAATAAEIGARLGEANCIKSRGEVHLSLAEYALARSCYEKAEPIYREIGDRLGEANCLRFQALLEVDANKPSLAVEKFNRALKIAEAIGDRFTQAFIGLEIAEPLVALKQTLQAKENLNRAIVLFEAINRPDRAKQCREKLAEIGK